MIDEVGHLKEYGAYRRFSLVSLIGGGAFTARRSLCFLLLDGGHYITQHSDCFVFSLMILYAFSAISLRDKSIKYACLSPRPEIIIVAIIVSRPSHQQHIFRSYGFAFVGALVITVRMIALYS